MVDTYEIHILVLPQNHGVSLTLVFRREIPLDRIDFNWEGEFTKCTESYIPYIIYLSVFLLDCHITFDQSPFECQDRSHYLGLRLSLSLI